MVDKNHDNWALLESFGKYITVICSVGVFDKNFYGYGLKIVSSNVWGLMLHLY